MIKRTSVLLALAMPILIWAAPANPSNLQFTNITDTSITLSWQDISNNERGFKILRNGKLIDFVKQNVKSYTDRGLSPHTQYKYEVKASDDFGFKLTGDFYPKASHVGLFIDTDHNANTGYHNQGINGAEIQVSNGHLYSRKNPDTNKWSDWQDVGSSWSQKTDNTMFITFDESQLNGIQIDNDSRIQAFSNNEDYTSKRALNVTPILFAKEQENVKNVPIIMIGPSTVYINSELNGAVKEPKEDRTKEVDCRLEGWGQRLYEYANNPNDIYNYAHPGNGSTTFVKSPDDIRAECDRETNENKKINCLYELYNFGPNRDHYWAKVVEKMQALGEGILLIQFGANEPAGVGEEAFKHNIQNYIDEAKNLNFTPVLITEIEKRRKLADGTLEHSRGDFPIWMKEIAKDNNLRVLDLTQKSYAEYSRLMDSWDDVFGNCYGRWGSRSKEDTHFEPKGAKVVAGWIRDLACTDRNSQLCKQLSATPKTFTLSSPNFIPAHGIPALSWNHTPKATKSFAIIIDDYDPAAKDGTLNWIHWSVVNINKNTKSVTANTVPNGALVEINSNGSRGYADPRFPETHKYVAHIYALDVEDLTKVKYINGTKIYKNDTKYDHKEFERIFGNFIVEKSEISSK